MNDHFTYRPSGKIGPLAWLIFALEAILLLPMISILYAYLIVYIPIIYLNVLVVIGFALILGVSIYPIVKFGKVRGKKGETLFGVLMWGVAMYWQWCAHLTLLFGIDDGSSFFTPGGFDVGEFMYMATHPADLWSNITFLGSVGNWGFGDTTVKGSFLWLVWIVEAIMLLGGAILATQGWSKLPFSEATNRWYKRRPLPKRIQLHRGISKFIEGFQNQDLSELGNTPVIDSSSAEFTELVIFESPGEESAYLAFYNQELEVDNKGNKKKKYRRNGDFYYISPEMNMALSQFFE